jgi:SpoVK/Ycf46/Vps4 family AAA+-type ATPase
MLGSLLTWMQDNNASGIIAIGPPGAAKSAIAKATGNEGGIPTIALDLGGMKGSLVGESEARLRGALKVIDAVSQGRALFIATCNSIGVLPPELRRRFTFGTFYFSMPDSEERKQIWSIYRKKYSIPGSDPTPDDAQWTGAEIRQCCLLAKRLKRSLAQCASFIVPVAKSAAAQIAQLREQADGRFISASHPGVYRKDSEPKFEPVVSGRAINLEGD